ncbi:uncharacterized protein LOC117628483 isoform X2 [Prunus dulcis]|uniref:uncharacterized protein LOC117628483 isoform X2 n=1 Tax=Prunus dulcis TaxID=3755 RepID=UPI001481E307|nr:uncharacterized protein LOC117628483 isoform X2 [Prunus dulcis]
MLTFQTTLRNIKDRRNANKQALRHLAKTPFWNLISAYREGYLTNTNCKKSNYDILRLINTYNPETKKFNFRAGNEYAITSQDVADIFGLPNHGKQLPNTTTSTRPKLDFVNKYFMGVETLTKTEIDRFLDKALEDETPQGPMDVTRFIILELFISNLFCNSGCTLAWTCVTTINTVKDMKQYNWAKGVLDYMHFGLDQAIKNKKDKKKQPSVSGCLVLILYWLCQRGNLISPIVGREDMTPAAARWSLPELNVMLTHLKNEHIKITIAENEDDNEEKESDTEHNDGGDDEDNEENQDENEQENQDQLLKQLHKRYKQAVQNQESKLTLNDWCKGKKQNTGKGENDIAQRQLFTSGETVKNDAEQTTSQIHEQKEKMNEHNMDEDIATNQNEQVQEKHQQQLESQPDSQEKMYQNIFVEMVGSIPEYYKDEMKPTHDRIHELKEAVDYWIDKAEDLKYKMQVAIQSCMEKNAFIEKVCSEKEAAQERTKKLKKKLEQQEEQNKKLQAQLEEEKLKRRHLQNNYELLERDKMSCIETMKQNDFDIASLALWGL